MFSVSVIAFTFLILTMGAEIIFRPFVVKNIRKVFSAAISAVLLSQFYLSYIQYKLWKFDETAKFLLPPYQTTDYFLTYVSWRVFVPYALSLAIGLIFFWLAKKYNERHQGQFFYNEEYYYIALSFFLVGHPFWIFYAILLIITISSIIAFRHFIFKKTDKVSLSHFWLPMAAFVILISKWIIMTDWFLKLKI